MEEQRVKDRRIPPPNGNGETIDFQGFGAKVKIKGKDLVVVMLIIAFASLITALGWLHHNDMTQSNQKLSQQITEMIYVLALPEAERKALDITMPDSLRLKRRGHRPKDEP